VSLVPVTVRLWVVPTTADPPTKMFMVTVGEPPAGGVMGLGEKDMLTSAGAPEAVRVTGELKPCSEATVTPTLPNVPFRIVVAA
jgi:hypothetical protein